MDMITNDDRISPALFGLMDVITNDDRTSPDCTVVYLSYVK